MSNNIDQNSIGGTFFTFCTLLLSEFQVDTMSKYGLWCISAAVGITTIIYNIKKIKKLDK
jgi:hypothetical protein